MTITLEQAFLALGVAVIFFVYVSYHYLTVSNRLLCHLRDHHRSIWQGFMDREDILNHYRSRFAIGRFLGFTYSEAHKELGDRTLSMLVMQTRVVMAMCVVAWILLIAGFAILAVAGSW